MSESLANSVKYVSGLFEAIQKVKSEGLPESYYFEQKKILQQKYPTCEMEIPLKKKRRVRRLKR